MKDILRMVAKDNEIVIEKMEVMPDYVHVLISFPPSKAPTSAIKALKRRSAFIFLKRHPEIRQSQYWGGHLWSPSYYMSKDVVENYINNQKYNALQKKKRPNGRWVSLSIPWLKSRDFRLGIIKNGWLAIKGHLLILKYPWQQLKYHWLSAHNMKKSSY